MIKSRVVLAGALLAVAGAASAAVTVTPTIASDYDFRGISQTDGATSFGDGAAFQLGATYTHDSGFYGSIWGSNVDFGTPDPDVELDFAAGFTGGDAAESIGYDLGVVYYTYVNAGSLNTFEAYAGISHQWFSGKLSYSPDVGSSKDDGVYLEGNGTFPLAQDFSLLAHAGYSFGDYWSNSGAKYTDWSIGVGKTFGKVATTLKYVDNDLTGAVSRHNVGGHVILSFSTTLPWSAE